MIIYTGWVTAVTIICAVLSTALIHELADLMKGSSLSTIAALRWTLLIVVGIAIFIVGYLTNRKKVMRAGLKGQPVEGAPNTIFFVPLQYWAVLYLGLIGTAIVTWASQEAARR